MARTPAPVPRYLKHPNRPTARCWAAGRWVYLGAYDSPESHEAFRRVCAELTSGIPAATAHAAGPAATMNEVCLAFLDHAVGFYVRPDGTQTKEVDEFKQAIRAVRGLYGATPAREFGPRSLKAVRAAMVELGWCRSRVNAQVRRVRRMLKWAASEELVPGSLVADLATVAGLRKNRSEAHETEPVKPVPEDDYRAALPFMVPSLRAMCELQRLAGLRPCEVRLLIPDDLDRSGDLWVYRPAQHKMDHLGIKKAIPLSPSARAVIEPWLVDRGPTDYLFTPRQAMRELNERKRAARKTKVQPSQLDRSKPEAEKLRHTPAAFDTSGYAQWVARACKRAGVAPWTPGRLRHSFGTEVRSRFGLEVAQVLLGHKHAKTSEIYAEKTLAAGMEAAKVLG